MPSNAKAIATANAAGLSGGTGFAGMVLLMPNGTLKSLLLVLSPAITLIIGGCWSVATHEIRQRVGDWRLQRQRQKLSALCDRLDHDPHASSESKRGAKKALDMVTQIEVEMATRRAKAADQS